MRTETKLFAGVLVGTMALSNISLFALSILASDLIDEFGISRGQIGLLTTANTAAGAILSPALGRLTDRVGGRRSILTLLTLSSIGIATLALARSYPALLLGAVVGGIPQGWGNPATNKLIVERLAEGSRGVVVGIKQSGVQVGVFMAGITLPVASNSFGWRWGIAAFAVLTMFLISIAAFVLDPDDPRPVGDGSRFRLRPGERASKEPIPPLVSAVAFYALLLGMVGGGVNRFIPLFAHEELGYSTAVAGFAAAMTGLLAIGTRIWWSRRAEIRGDTITPLVLMAVSASVAALLLAGSQVAGPAMLWPVVVIGAFSISAWNSVANLRVLNSVPTASAGRATGVILLGFFSGLAIGAPLVGWSVDQWGTYTPAWLVLAALAAAAAVVIKRPLPPPRPR